MEEEGRLNDVGLRENFIERVFAWHRWQQFLADKPTKKGLVAFHTAHKMTLMSHSVEAYRALGRLVASVGKRPWASVRAGYAEGHHLQRLRPRGRARCAHRGADAAGPIPGHQGLGRGSRDPAVRRGQAVGPSPPSDRWRSPANAASWRT